jgi:hypothetical protein
VPLIFLSYRREDAAGYAGRLRESLEERFGEGRVFRDVDTLEPGQDFVQAIEQRVAQCTAFLALVGREWLETTDNSGRLRLQQPDDYVRREIAAALARPDLLVIPVLVEGVSMPPSTDLPEDIRALARRHAVSLRDETWVHDVDRLAGAITRALDQYPNAGKATQRDRTVGPPRRWLKHAGLAGFGILMLALGITLPRLRPGRTDPGRPDPDSVVPPNGETGVAFKIDLPRVAEFEIGESIYTLLWASLTPRPDGSVLRLRLRFSNEGQYAANFYSSGFRLDLGRQVVAASDGTNTLVPGYSIEHGEVVFQIPAGTRRAMLRIVDSESAELPLDLSRSGRLSRADTSDPGDAMSRAIVTSIAANLPAELLATPTARYALTRATARLFVNKIRLEFAIRLANASSSGDYFNDANFRLAVAGEVSAPVSGPAGIVPGNSTTTGNFVFEVPTQTRHVTLRVLQNGQIAAERNFDIPSRR